MFPCAKRIVRSGGKPVATHLPARQTGIKAGTGPQVRATGSDGVRVWKREIKDFGPSG